VAASRRAAVQVRAMLVVCACMAARWRGKGRPWGFRAIARVGAVSVRAALAPAGVFTTVGGHKTWPGWPLP
jgi:hypothetical protein